MDGFRGSSTHMVNSIFGRNEIRLSKVVNSRDKRKKRKKENHLSRVQISRK